MKDAAPAALPPTTSDSIVGIVNTPNTFVTITKSKATAELPLQAFERVTQVERVVGTQQKTARPSAISGGCSGKRITPNAANGVINRVDRIPKAIAIGLRSAAAASPLCSKIPEIIKIPIVEKVCKLRAAAKVPGPGHNHPKTMDPMRAIGM